MGKAPTMAEIQSDVKWTKYYIEQIRIAKRAKDYESARQWANEISAIWGSVEMQFDEAQQ